MKKEDSWLLYSIIIGLCITMLLTLIPVWQLVIIPGTIAGFLNKSMKRAVLSGILSVFLAWLIYIVVGIISRNVYTTLDQFGALIFGEGSGGLLLTIIVLLSIVFGALGGGLGNCLLSMRNLYIVRRSLNKSKS